MHQLVTRRLRDTCIPFCKPAAWYSKTHMDGLVQERRNSSALAMELRLSCTNPSIYGAATNCHQVCCMHWGHPSLFHAYTSLKSLLSWYKIVCMGDVLYRFIWIKSISMLSMHVQSATPAFSKKNYCSSYTEQLFWCLWTSMMPTYSSRNM